MKKQNEKTSIESFRATAAAQAQKMRESLAQRGVDQKSIDEQVASFMLSIEQSIKKEQDERN